MKFLNIALKLVAAIAAVAGIAYLIAKNMDAITEWLKNLCPCKADEEICEEDFAEEAAAEEAPVEEAVEEEAPAEEAADEAEEVAEEVAPEIPEGEPVAEESDFEE